MTLFRLISAGLRKLAFGLTLAALGAIGGAAAASLLLGGSFFFANLVFLTVAFPMGNDLISKTRSFRPFAEKVRGFVGANDYLFSHGASDFGLIFYLKRPVQKYDSDLTGFPQDKDAFIVLPVAEWDENAARLRTRFVELARSQALGSDGNRPLVLIRTKN